MSVQEYVCSREFDYEVCQYENDAEKLAQLREQRAAEGDDGGDRVQQLRMRCWQLECSAILIQVGEHPKMHRIISFTYTCFYVGKLYAF